MLGLCRRQRYRIEHITQEGDDSHDMVSMHVGDEDLVNTGDLEVLNVVVGGWLVVELAQCSFGTVDHPEATVFADASDERRAVASWRRTAATGGAQEGH